MEYPKRMGFGVKHVFVQREGVRLEEEQVEILKPTVRFSQVFHELSSHSRLCKEPAIQRDYYNFSIRAPGIVDIPWHFISPCQQGFPDVHDARVPVRYLRVALNRLEDLPPTVPPFWVPSRPPKYVEALDRLHDPRTGGRADKDVPKLGIW
jgi:hypothetical protein